MSLLPALVHMRSAERLSALVRLVGDETSERRPVELVGICVAALTRIAHDGPTALRVAAEFEPTVALLDIGLPVMDGYELARRLRSDSGLSNLRLIAVTSYGQQADRQRSEAAGFDAHLVKPVQFDVLTEVLDEH